MKLARTSKASCDKGDEFARGVQQARKSKNEMRKREKLRKLFAEEMLSCGKANCSANE